MISGDDNVASQLELLGLTEMRRRADMAPSSAVRSRLLNKIESTHNFLTELPTNDDLSFMHSGLCQTCLPHSRPSTNHAPWKRQSGRFTLLVSPGVMDPSLRSIPSATAKISKKQPSLEETPENFYVGVPFGTKARLIMIHLQTEGLKSRTVSLGHNLSAFLRSLGLDVRGGARGTIGTVKEQCLRIARCTFTLQWSNTNDAGDQQMIISDTKIVEGMNLWNANREDWSGVVELSVKFHEHLREHAVPLDRRAIAMLSGNSLALDLYALFAYRLPRLNRDLHLSWAQLQGQIGTEYSDGFLLARRVREVMPQVRTAYSNAKVEITRHGILMKNSSPVVPKNYVTGFRVIEGQVMT